MRLLGGRVDDARLAPGLDVLGQLAQGELAQRAQVLGAEEVRKRRLDPAHRVDLARPQALLQLLRREVDQHDLVGLVQQAVGERLAHAHAGQLEDRVVQALEVLDVHGGDDVDAGVEHVLDVLVALVVARAGGVGVSELVDQRAARAPAG